jgi:hypothetical protein
VIKENGRGGEFKYDIPYPAQQTFFKKKKLQEPAKTKKRLKHTLTIFK